MLALVLYIILFALSCFVLFKSSSWLSISLKKIARSFHWREFTVAGILMALITSAPDLLVGINSALAKSPSILLGNVLGSIIIDFTLVIGLVVILSKGINLRDKISPQQRAFLFFIIIFPLLLLLDSRISRIDGVILLGVFGAHLFYLIKEKRKKIKVLSFKKNQSPIRKSLIPFKLIKNFSIFFIGAILLLLGSWGVVKTGINLAGFLGVPLFIIGLFVVAIGTSMPELAFGIRSALNHSKSMSIGNILSTVAINSSLVLGLTAIIYPIEIASQRAFLITAVFVILAILLLNFFMRTQRKITWQEGVWLVLFYVLFAAVQSIMR